MKVKADYKVNIVISFYFNSRLLILPSTAEQGEIPLVRSTSNVVTTLDRTHTRTPLPYPLLLRAQKVPGFPAIYLQDTDRRNFLTCATLFREFGGPQGL